MCDCGPRTIRAGRLTRRRLDDDPGERNLALAYDATGERPRTCPWRSLRDPFVAEVLEAHRHWDKGQLADHYRAKHGSEVPPEIDWGVVIFDAALKSVHSADMRLDREEREREQQRRQSHPNASATPPKPRRR